VALRAGQVGQDHRQRIGGEQVGPQQSVDPGAQVGTIGLAGIHPAQAAQAHDGGEFGQQRTRPRLAVLGLEFVDRPPQGRIALIRI